MRTSQQVQRMKDIFPGRFGYVGAMKKKEHFLAPVTSNLRNFFFRLLVTNVKNVKLLKKIVVDVSAGTRVGERSL